MEQLEHPAITRCCETGYAESEELTFETDCHDFVGAGTDTELQNGDWGGVYEWDNQYICPDCMMEKLDEMTLKEKAELLGARFIPINELLER